MSREKGERRYWIKMCGSAWEEVTRERFVDAECLAGHKRPDGEKGFVGCRMQGRITIGKITKERDGWDPQFLAAAETSLGPQIRKRT